ncbi:DNA-3-methyladenine glycosylase family protein [Alkalibacterium olivapovliticus]|uniref:DNA-3-methyladenine glycosylase II n=1 Tax=Alkalibacterium olivapovliticus TaxID=99907 RepID=A0A2T0W9Q2_9LACT|nr:DNA-3-methyladenine glycosylase [Alkalibacterium olivapovliticus]PRY83417.1 DNA-3-methyladenine glycosylase II [Alkalibacterium olivapovliticus]
MMDQEEEEKSAYFTIDPEALEYLKKADPVLGKAIDAIGKVRRVIRPNLYTALVNSIIGQQISTKAQQTIWNRLEDKLGEVTPENILSLSDEEVQSIGISFRKVSYIKQVSKEIVQGDLDLNELQTMSDDEVTQRLSQIKGVGVWTAEMLMIFSMGREDILSWDDLAIHRGLRMLYHHRRITKKLFAKYKRRYSPYSSIASLYLWEIAGGAVSDMKDYAPLTEAQKKRRARSRRHTKSVDPKR